MGLAPIIPDVKIKRNLGDRSYFLTDLFCDSGAQLNMFSVNYAKKHNITIDYSDNSTFSAKDIQDLSLIHI